MRFYFTACLFSVLRAVAALFVLSWLSPVFCQDFNVPLDETRAAPELSKEAQEMDDMLVIPQPSPTPEGQPTCTPGVQVVPTPEEEIEGEEPFVTDADKVEYIRDQNIIVGTGNAIIRYKGLKLLADRITVYLDTNDAFAEGNVKLFREEQYFVGDSLQYNFDTGTGALTNATGWIPPWYAKGEVIRKISKDEYQVDNGYMTTCYYEKPHYKIKAKKIVVYPGDCVVAKNVVFEVHDMPIMWSPFIKYSLVDRDTPFNFVPGYSSDFGVFLLTAFDLYKTENIKTTAHLDLRSRKGVGIGLDVSYNLPSAETIGKLKAYYTTDRDFEAIQSLSNADRKDRYRISWEHYQQIAPDTRAVLKANYLSDPDVIDEFFRDEFVDEIQPETYLNITKATDRYQITLRVEPRLNDFYTVVERLPELSLEVRNQRLGESPIFYESESSMTNLLFKHGDLDDEDRESSEELKEEWIEGFGLEGQVEGKDYDSVRLDTFHQFSYPHKYFRWLNLNPFFGFRQTFYTNIPGPTDFLGDYHDNDGDGLIDEEVLNWIDDDADGLIDEDLGGYHTFGEEHNKWRGYYVIGAEGQTKLSRIYNVYNKALGINRLRHVIEPKVKYTYLREPTHPSKDIYQFDEIDYFNEANFFTFSLRNSFQTKREGDVVDLADLRMEIEFFPKSKSQYQENHFLDPHMCEVEDFKRAFSDLYMDLELRPFRWLNMDIEAYWDFYDQDLDECNIDFFGYRGDNWALALGYRYLRTNSNLITSEITYRFNDMWAVRNYTRYEAATGKLEQIDLSLSRDLHAWESAVTFRYRGLRDDDISIFFVLSLDDYPFSPIILGN